MARPWKDPKTHVWYLRQRTPRDLLPRLKGTTVSLPVGDQVVTVKVGEIVQASLRTKEAVTAKERHAEADAALRRFWDAQRAGAVTLSNKQAVALAGTLYKLFAETLEDNPGSPEMWKAVGSANEKALSGSFGRSSLMIQPSKTASLEERFGPFVDVLLRQEGLIVDQASRERLLKAAGEAMQDAARRLERSAQGDYTPDAKALRFPEWERPEAKQEASRPAPSDTLTAEKLFDMWLAKKVTAASTVRRYRASWRSFISFIGTKDVRLIEDADIYAWAVHRRDVDGISPAVINKNDLVAISSVFRWATSFEGGKLLDRNPVTKEVKLDAPRVEAKREKTFRNAEIRAILTLATSTPPDPENPTLADAKRWCPWLTAYSGARIAEVTRLEAADIRNESGIWVMDLRQTKTRRPRTVPLHEHLIEQGFIDFVRRKASGPLFYDPKRHKKGAATSPAEIRARKLADWVREEVGLDMAVDPNHGWRHTFKTKAASAGIDARFRDEITGHEQNVARSYEAPTVEDLAEAIRRFPRYVVISP